MWPNSAAAPNWPRTSWPLITMPPPMPVPTVKTTTCSLPRPAPKRTSAQAAALASFSTTTISPSRRCSDACKGSSRQARFGENITVARRASMNPAAPTPTASTPYEPVSSATTVTIASSIWRTSSAGVSR
jgi:hypothetical protein